jgi:hypothetical protein
MSSCIGFTHKIKMVVPKFDDEDDCEGTRWINKLKHYCDIYQIHDDEEIINLVSMHLERLGCHWFLWWN